MYLFTAAVLLVTGVVHLLPLTGVTGAAALTRLYGASIEDPNLLLLMRHRAVLFGLLGAGLVGSAFYSEYHRTALIAGLISTLSFVVLAWSADAYSPQVNRVILIDVVAASMLAVALMLPLIIRS